MGLFEALIIGIGLLVVTLAIFYARVYPKLRGQEYRRFIAGWMAFFGVAGVLGLAVAVGLGGFGVVAALVNFVVAMLVAYGVAPFVFTAAARMDASHGVSSKAG